MGGRGDGLMAQAVTVKDISSCRVYSYASKGEDRVNSTQELEARCVFNVNIAYKKGIKGVRGVTWCESLLLAPFTVFEVNKLILCEDGSSNPLWRHTSQDTVWSIVVIARLSVRKPWAPENYPLGFSQCPCVFAKKSLKKMKSRDAATVAASKTAASAMARLPISPERRLSGTIDRNFLLDRYAISVTYMKEGRKHYDSFPDMILMQAGIFCVVLNFYLCLLLLYVF